MVDIGFDVVFDFVFELMLGFAINNVYDTALIPDRISLAISFPGSCSTPFATLLFTCIRCSALFVFDFRCRSRDGLQLRFRYRYSCLCCIRVRFRSRFQP